MPTVLPGEDDVSAQLGGLRASRCGVFRNRHQRTLLRGRQHLIRVGGVTFRVAAWEPFAQPAKRVVELPERELIHAECVNEHLEGDPLGLWEQQGPPRLPRLGTSHAGIDDGSRALLKYHGDTQVTSDLEAVRLRQGHEKLPGGQRPYGLANLLLGRQLVEEVDDGIDRHHLGQAVAAQGHRSGAHQVKHRIDQARRHTDICVCLCHDSSCAVAGTRAARRTRRSPTSISMGRAATTLGNVQPSGCTSADSSR